MPDRCWRCAAEIAQDVAFCGSCGAPLRSDSRRFDLSLDAGSDGPVRVEAAPAGGSRWGLVAGLAMVAVVVGVFAATSADDTDPPDTDPIEEAVEPEPVDEPEPTPGPETTTITTPPAAEPEPAAGLSWAIARDDVDGFPFALVEVGRSVFAYVAEAPPRPARTPSGTRAFEYTRTGSWIDHGLVIDAPADVTTVVNGDTALWATGLDGAGEPAMWRSDDGISWTKELLPAAPADVGVTRPTHLIERNGVVAVAATTVDVWERIEAAAIDVLGDALVGRTGIDWNPSRTDVDIRGPFGLRLATVTFDDLGLDGEQLLEAMSGPSSTPRWVRADGTWVVDTTRGDATTLTAGSTGEIHLVTNADVDQISTYRNGGWERRDTGTEAFRLSAWDDRFIGEVGAGRIAMFDADFELIDETQAPSAGDPTTTLLDQLVPGPLGVITSVVRWDPTAGAETDGPDPTVVVLRDGYRLEADPLHLLRLTRDGEPLVDVDALSSDDGYRVDLTGPEPLVVFLDSDTGADLVGFTVDELRLLEAESTPSGSAGAPVTSVFFSRDAEVWLGGEMKVLDPARPALVQTHVGSERLWAFVITMQIGRFTADDDVEFTLMQVEPPPE
ncbi:MAG: zinc ribbon domain-containing protein [Actinomycetota bacterium]